MIRSTLVGLVMELTNMAYAGMEFAAVAVPVDQSRNIPLNTRLLLGAITTKSENALYLDKAWDVGRRRKGERYDKLRRDCAQT